MLKKLFIGAMTLLMCSVASAADWKKCNASLVLVNTTGTKLVYNIAWLDHDIEIYKGQYMPRAGGELLPHEKSSASKDFRLCLGRHKVIWYVSGEWSVSIQYDFVVTEDMTQVVLSPDGFIVK